MSSLTDYDVIPFATSFPLVVYNDLLQGALGPFLPPVPRPRPPHSGPIHCRCGAGKYARQ